MHVPTSEAAGGESPAAIISETEPPMSFLCKSGVLLWGQLNTIIQGFNSLKLDTSEGPAEVGSTGTNGSVVLHAFRFRVAAKKGRWRVEPALIGERRFGFVCFHEEVDGVEILRRATNVGISINNQHEDSNIVYVHRYDWSWEHGPNVELILQTVGIGENDESARMVDGEEYYSNLVATRFMLLDEQGYHSLIRSVKNGVRLHPRNYLLSGTALEHGDGSAFGVHLSLGEDSFERGWMAFSDGVLVGFVYDGNNSCLDLGSTTQLSLGNVIVGGELRRDDGDEEDDGEIVEGMEEEEGESDSD